jgi:hypothetical protein
MKTASRRATSRTTSRSSRAAPTPALTLTPARNARPGAPRSAGATDYATDCQSGSETAAQLIAWLRSNPEMSGSARFARAVESLDGASPGMRAGFFSAIGQALC